jgi:uncharacterized protein
LKDLADRWQELDRLANLRTKILYEAGAFIDAKPYAAGAYRERTSLMREIRREGVDLTRKNWREYERERELRDGCGGRCGS